MACQSVAGASVIKHHKGKLSPEFNLLDSAIERSAPSLPRDCDKPTDFDNHSFVSMVREFGPDVASREWKQRCAAHTYTTPVEGEFYIETDNTCVGPFTTYKNSPAQLAQALDGVNTLNDAYRECAQLRGQLVSNGCTPTLEYTRGEGLTLGEFRDKQGVCSTLVDPRDDLATARTKCSADTDCAFNLSCDFSVYGNPTVVVPGPQKYPATDALRAIGECVDPNCEQVVLRPHIFDAETGLWKYATIDRDSLSDYAGVDAPPACQFDPQYFDRSLGFSRAVTEDDKSVATDFSMFSRCVERGDCREMIERISVCAQDYNGSLPMAACDSKLRMCDYVDELHGMPGPTAPSVRSACTRVRDGKQNNRDICMEFSPIFADDTPDPEDFCMLLNPKFDEAAHGYKYMKDPNASEDNYANCLMDAQRLTAEEFSRICHVAEIKLANPALVEAPCLGHTPAGVDLCESIQTIDEYVATSTGHATKAEWAGIKARVYPLLGCDVQPLRDVAARDGVDAFTLMDITNGFRDYNKARKVSDERVGGGFTAPFAILAADKTFNDVYAPEKSQELEMRKAIDQGTLNSSMQERGQMVEAAFQEVFPELAPMDSSVDLVEGRGAISESHTSMSNQIDQPVSLMEARGAVTGNDTRVNLDAPIEFRTAFSERNSYASARASVAQRMSHSRVAQDPGSETHAEAEQRGSANAGAGATLEARRSAAIAHMRQSQRETAATIESTHERHVAEVERGSEHGLSEHIERG